MSEPPEGARDDLVPRDPTALAPAGGPAPRFADTTLRDGEQAVGVAFSAAQKERIARLLDAAGVAEIEAGTPIMGADEAAAVSRVASLGLRARVSAWCRGRREDLEAALRCGVQRVNLCLPVSEPMLRHKLGRSEDWLLDTLEELTRWARSEGLGVTAGAEDASRAPLPRLLRVAERARAAGADRLRFSDTVGCLDPFGTHGRIGGLRAAGALDLEVHAHDDLGLATANTLAGLRAGAGWASVTVLGLGERAGNAALEEVAVALRYGLQREHPLDLAVLPELCAAVAEAAGRPIPGSKAVVGCWAFAHESGIHADGVLKHPSLYEAFPPAAVGRRHSIFLGKHSGSAAVAHHLGRLGLSAPAPVLARVVEGLRSPRWRSRLPLGDPDLVELWKHAGGEGETRGGCEVS